MSTLTSPGVSISVTDESFYSAAGTGTVPLLIIATAQDKSSPDGTGTAAYTTAAEAGSLKLITSQRELIQNYGTPAFYNAGGSPMHGYELNEYGLLAAHSFLGLSSRAYVVRADLDLGELIASSTAPVGAVANGTYWLDFSETAFGLKVYNTTTSKWEAATVKVPGSDQLTAGVPKNSFGVDGDYAVAVTDSLLKYFVKSGGAWQVAGTSKDFQFATHLTLPSTQRDGTSLENGDFIMQTTTPNNGASFALKVYNSTTGQFTSLAVPVYADTDAVLNDITPSSSTVVALQSDLDNSNTAVLTFKSHSGDLTLSKTFAASVDSNINLSAANITITENSNIATVDTSGLTDVDVDTIVSEINDAISSSNITTVVAGVSSNTITLTNTTGRDVVVASSNPAVLANIGAGSATSVTYTNFTDLTFTGSSTQPAGDLADGTLWYNATVSQSTVDLLEHNGSTWVTFTGELVVSATQPTATDYSAGDIWLDSDDLENFPRLYKQVSNAWVEIDNTDQVTEDGIVFADFRASSTASLDSDAPQASAYPSGILAWNKRASSMNVKSWDAANSRWTDESGNRNDGSPYMGRKATRAVIKNRMQAAIASNTDLRSETNQFNLIAAPGFPELLDEMLTLSGDRKNTAFVVGDTPFRLGSSATELTAWATNANSATENGEEGLVSASPYAAVYYPSGLSTNLDGTSVVVPASHMALRTIALNDQTSFPWFAPAGLQRGLVTNATSVGYVDSTSGEYIPVTLNEGQRDALYANKINPIVSFPGRGITVFGQKTLNPTASALDRVNVARLTVYIRERLEDLVRPFLFEPNDEITRSNAKNVVDGFLSELVTQRGVFDFITVCDTTNNTPARIDRNELYIDVAIQPLKAVEFIYIPIRIQNTLGQTG